MPLVSRILLPVDFSARCRGAAQYAEALAHRFGCEIVLLHVVIQPVGAYSPPEALSYSSAADVAEGMAAQRKVQLQSFLEQELPSTSTRLVAEGDPARKIAECAAERSCDLIVMPTHGHGPFRRFLLGSVTASVLQDAPCPVWTGPHLEKAPNHDTIQFRKVACAIDLGPQSREILDWAAQFARYYDSALIVVHAIPKSAARVNGVYFDPEWRIEVADKARKSIESLLHEVGAVAEISIEMGEPASAVPDVAMRTGSDLLVIGRGNRRLLERLRPQAYAILRESPCPVAAV